MSQHEEEAIHEICVITQMINNTTQISSLIWGSSDNQVLEIPKNHLEDCFCTRLSKLTNEELATNCRCKYFKNAYDIHDYLVETCVHGLTYATIPIMKNDQTIAILQLGPILTTCATKTIDAYINSKAALTPKERAALASCLASIPRRDIDFISSFAHTIALTLSDGYTVSGSHKPLVHEFRGDDACSKEIMEKIDTAVRYINENYLNDISLNEVAEIISLHPTRLSRLFSRCTGSSFRGYINRLRIVKAQKLLLDPSLNIAEICYQTGFSDQSYFDKVFKLSLGYTPSQFRERNLDER